MAFIEMGLGKRSLRVGNYYGSSYGYVGRRSDSNFCGPQFAGMWRDVEWHKRLTSIIRSSPLDESLTKNNEVAAKLLKRL